MDAITKYLTGLLCEWSEGSTNLRSSIPGIASPSQLDLLALLLLRWHFLVDSYQKLEKLSKVKRAYGTECLVSWCLWQCLDCVWNVKIVCKGKCTAIVKARVFSCSNSLFYHLISYQIAERYRGDRRWWMKMTKQISCDLCPEIFTSRRGLYYHKQIHSGVKIKKYNCLQCNKSFSTNSNLNIHSLIHSGERPHECTQCNFLCSDPSYFRRHIKNTWLKK